MTGRGRPLRFLALVMSGWIGVRVVILWPEAGSLPEAIRLAVPIASAAEPMEAVPETLSPEAPSVDPAPPAILAQAKGAVASPPAWAAPAPRDPVRVQFALAGLIQYGAPRPVRPAGRAPAAGQSYPLGSPDRGPGRWSGSVWIAARGGSGAAPGGGQIGGGQAGVRVAYRLLPEAGISAFGRVTAPLSGAGRKAAVGVEWQIGRMPVRVLVEQRIGMDQPGASGPAVGVIAGIDRQVAGFRLEAYGQAGAVFRERTDPYVDGAVRVTRDVADAPVRVALGGGAWGAAQRGAVRLDAGPTAVLGLPAGDAGVRLAVDWRQRVTGQAAPGSGLAVTLGADF